MPQAIGDPEALTAFATALSQYIENIQTETNGLKGHFTSLGETWQDEKRAQFEEEFNTLVAQIQQFGETCSEYVPYLQTLAAKLQDYLNS